jgi:hypothetical protein
MPRTKAVTPKSLLKAWIPQEMRAKLDLKLFSDLEGRVPLGDYSKYVEQLIRQDLEWAKLDLGLFGGSLGFFVIGPKAMIDELRSRLTG